MIGLGPAKHSHAMAVLDRSERQLAALQVLTATQGEDDGVVVSR
jgi:hypothetical protein